MNYTIKEAVALSCYVYEQITHRQYYGSGITEPHVIVDYDTGHAIETNAQEMIRLVSDLSESQVQLLIDMHYSQAEQMISEYLDVALAERLSDHRTYTTAIMTDLLSNGPDKVVQIDYSTNPSLQFEFTDKWEYSKLQMSEMLVQISMFLREFEFIAARRNLDIALDRISCNSRFIGTVGQRLRLNLRAIEWCHLEDSSTVLLATDDKTKENLISFIVPKVHPIQNLSDCVLEADSVYCVEVEVSAHIMNTALNCQETVISNIVILKRIS